MIVLCLEGCHGSGKSTVLEQFRSMGFETLSEGFMEDDKEDSLSFGSLPPQCLISECRWLNNWMSRLMRVSEARPPAQAQAPLHNLPDRVLITDRSPYTAVCYAGSQGDILEPVISAQIREAYSLRGIEIYTAHLVVEPERLWGRICERLAREPERKVLQEGSRHHMDAIRSWYDKFRFDLEVENEGDLRSVAAKLLASLSDLRQSRASSASSTPKPAQRGAFGSAVKSAAATGESPTTVMMDSWFQG